MPLQNRCDPFGELHSVAARGSMMGNRGGRIHDPARKILTNRRWASKAWICCVTDFRGRQHDVWGKTYTVMFFLDEVTALAAGHRPCFECRNKDAKAFAMAWAQVLGRDERLRAGEMDDRLHSERLISGGGSGTVLNAEELRALPDGTMIAVEDRCYALRDDKALLWSFNGYEKARLSNNISARLVTPPSVVDVLKSGYAPIWHGSAKAL